MRRIWWLAAVALALTAGCTTEKAATTKHLTQHQRDSILALEPVSGAGVVGRALAESDREQSGAAAMNSQVDSLPH
jgi:hypothetical protein